MKTLFTLLTLSSLLVLSSCKKTVLKELGTSTSFQTANGTGNENGGNGDDVGNDENSARSVECTILNSSGFASTSSTETMFYTCLRVTNSGSRISNGVSHHECQLDSEPWMSCATSSSHGLTGLSDGGHTFKVRAKWGNVTGTSAPASWTTNTSGGPGPSPSPTGGPVTVSCQVLTSFSGTRTNVTETLNYFCLRNQNGSGTPIAANVECSFDAGAWASCDATQVTSPPLSNGAHSFKVRATADGATGESTLFNWTTVVTVPSPSPTPGSVAISCSLISAPAQNSWSSSPNASLQYQCSRSVDGVIVPATLTYQCFKNGVGSACPSPTQKDYTSLADGQHTFYVQGSDGVVIGSSPMAVWNVDRTNPVMVSAVSTNGNTNPPRFDYLAQDGGGGGIKEYLCAFDGSSSFFSCSNLEPIGTISREFPALSVNANHTFHVKAKDKADNESNILVVNLRIDPPRPTGTCVITNGIPSPTRIRTQTMTFICSPEAVSTWCRFNGINAGAEFACTSPREITSLEGHNTFEVYYKDQYGQESDHSIQKTWEVDTTSPVVQIDAIQTVQLPASFNFSGNDPGRPGAHLTFSCLVKHSSGIGLTPDYAPCDSPIHYASGIIPGELYSFYVKGKDEAGNEGTASHLNWMINPGVGPGCQILTNFDPAWRNRPSERIDFFCSGRAGLATVLCEVSKNNVTSGWSNCDSFSTHTLSGLADEDHVSIRIKAIDIFANEGPPSSPLTWNVDRTPPTAVIAMIETDAPRASIYFSGNQDIRPPINTRGSPLDDHFDCQLSGIHSWTNCGSSPREYDGLSTSVDFVFGLRLKDIAGNITEVSSNSFRVNSTYEGPICTVTPKSAIPTRQNGFLSTPARDFDVSCTSRHGLERIECSGNGVDWLNCKPTDPKPAEFAWPTPTDGGVNLYVRGVDPNGVKGKVELQTWSVDHTPPTVLITDLKFNNGKAEVYFVIDDNGGSGLDYTQCKLEGKTDFENCTSPVRYAQGIVPGQSFKVLIKATDLVGLTTAEPQWGSRSWTNGGWQNHCQALCGAPGVNLRTCTQPAPQGGGLVCAGFANVPCTGGICLPVNGHHGWAKSGGCVVPKTCNTYGKQKWGCVQPREDGYASTCYRGQFELRNCTKTGYCRGHSMGMGDPPWPNGGKTAADCNKEDQYYSDSRCFTGIVKLHDPQNHEKTDFCKSRGDKKGKDYDDWYANCQ